MAGALVALAIVAPARATAQILNPLPGLLQPRGGQPAAPSGTAPPGSTPASSPPAGQNLAVTTRVSPVAWIDDASVLPPTSVAASISTLRWQGSDVSQVGFPVASLAVGLAPRLQASASVPRLMENRAAGGPGGLGTMFISSKVSVLDTTRLGMAGVRFAVAPTLEIVAPTALASPPANTRHARWGLPLSLDIAGAPVHVFSSAGYFSGGAWFAGGGIYGHLLPRLGASATFSHAWTTTADPTLRVTRNELSGGAAILLAPHVSVFGSVGRTIATTDADGAGVTVSAGLSFVRLGDFLRF
jgi:hypothetical protein